VPDPSEVALNQEQRFLSEDATWAPTRPGSASPPSAPLMHHPGIARMMCELVGRPPKPQRGGTMNPAELRDHCLSLTGAEETFPFGPRTSVFKVAAKMFALS
jgi:hypothetical protein